MRDFGKMIFSNHMEDILIVKECFMKEVLKRVKFMERENYCIGIITIMGHFFYGLKNGFGKENMEGDSYEGEFKGDKRDGKGVVYFKKNGNKFDGDFKEGKLTGKGIFIWKNGDKYEGHINNGVYEGYGRYNWTDGNWYEGNYEKGIRKGFGIFHWKDGRIYKGEFDNDVMHGNGVIIENGKETSCRFNNGKIVQNEKKKGLKEINPINMNNNSNININNNNSNSNILLAKK